MKSVFAIVLMTFALSSPGFAQQQRAHVLLSARLTSFNINAAESFAGANSGAVAIDLSTRTVTLSFERTPDCPTDRPCPRFIQNLGQVVLPLISRQVDNCGRVIFRAGRDLRASNGIFQDLHVTDNTGNRCPTFVALPPTGINLKTVPARASFNEQRVSEFTGTKLVQSSR